MENENRMVVGRDDLSMTVFVPWDCGKACTFCTSKEMYKNLDVSKVDLHVEEICRKIDMSRDCTFIRSYVFTGGEPLADTDRLLRLVQCARRTGKPVYVNVNSDAVLAVDSQDNWHRICALVDGFNVSIHLYYDTSTLRMSALESWLRYARSVRINCVVDPEKTYTSVEINRYLWNVSKGLNLRNTSIHFRRDYTKTDAANLHTHYDDFLRTLLGMKNLRYVGHSGCLVCANDMFASDYGLGVCYHRGLHHTFIADPVKRFRMVNDVIVTPDGTVAVDWPDMPGLDIPDNRLAEFFRGEDWGAYADSGHVSPVQDGNTSRKAEDDRDLHAKIDEYLAQKYEEKVRWLNRTFPHGSGGFGCGMDFRGSEGICGTGVCGGDSGFHTCRFGCGGHGHFGC